MKHVYKKLVLFVIFLLFSIDYCCAEGFAARTLIKVPAGYAAIENLRSGDCVLCYDADKSVVEGTISYITQKSVDEYVRIAIADECICVACDQFLYDESCDAWIGAGSLKSGDIVAGHAIAVERINKPIDMYLLSVAQHYNFFVTKSDVCAHNFFPPIVIVITGAFGGGLEIAGCSFGIAGLGSFLGYQWHKKNKQKHNLVLERMAFDITQESGDIYNLNDAQAPGMPTKKDGFYPPKKWDGKKVRNPNGPGYGWPDRKGSVWVPTGPNGHGCPHWDVEHPDGSYDNVVPGGRIRGKK